MYRVKISTVQRSVCYKSLCGIFRAFVGKVLIETLLCSVSIGWMKRGAFSPPLNRNVIGLYRAGRLPCLHGNIAQIRGDYLLGILSRREAEQPNEKHSDASIKCAAHEEKIVRMRTKVYFKA